MGWKRTVSKIPIIYLQFILDVFTVIILRILFPFFSQQRKESPPVLYTVALLSPSMYYTHDFRPKNREW